MSCNGCRVLRKGCSKTCEMRSCLRWIDSPDAQANATLFLAKFFGRIDLLSFISAVPDHERPALFKSLLFEACGRTVNPVNGAIGLLVTGKWNVCKAAVETVLSGGVPLQIQGHTAAFPTPIFEENLLPANKRLTSSIHLRCPPSKQGHVNLPFSAISLRQNSQGMSPEAAAVAVVKILSCLIYLSELRFEEN